MQAALCIAPPLLPLKRATKFSQLTPRLGGSLPLRRSAIKASSAVADDTSTVDYSSMTSVFPAEACETIGGEACLADMYPEVNPKPEASRNEAAATIAASEGVDREYVEYNDPKTVFRGEACDDLGGEFCGREYQRGVY